MNTMIPTIAQNSGSRHGHISSLVTIILLVVAAHSTFAQKSNDLTSRGLEDLMNIEVTSVSKKEEKLFGAAAAVYVITKEDIRRSGLTSVPELLRLAPGLSVARLDGNKWAITARGFNGRYANKLLVLIDGRSVYSPESSGVYWEVINLPLESIERIEVVRGPGGTLWGANAVNGVINIITKHTEDTLGGLVTAGGGTEERAFGSAQYGGHLGKSAHYRVFGKYFKHAGLLNAAGRSANDTQDTVQGGFRMDWQANDRDAVMLEGDVYHNRIRDTSLGMYLDGPFAVPTNSPGEFNGATILGRWTRTFSNGSDMAFQVYANHFSREIFYISDQIGTVDLDFQHHLSAGSKQSIVWGLGYRIFTHQSHGNNASPIDFIPRERTVPIYSGFVQDEISVVPDRLRLMIGAKLEHNPFSGFEVQPSVRLSWTPSNRQTFWGAITRAVRTPARTQQDIRVNFHAIPIPGGLTVVTAVFGNPESRAEVIRATELGYRAQVGDKLSLDVATFYNSYTDVTSFEPGIPSFQVEPFPQILVPFYYDNKLRGETYGTEASVNYSVNHNWRLQGSYTFLRLQLHAEKTSADTFSEPTEGNNPRHQFQLHSYLRLPHNLALDTSLYHVSKLSNLQIPRYTRVDARLGWRLGENFEMSGGVQNIFDEKHREFGGANEGVIPSLVKRSLYGKATWRF